MDDENGLGVDCTGCSIPLTVENLGGYRCFCQACVDVMPELPKTESKNGFYLNGYHPNFEWVKA